MKQWRVRLTPYVRGQMSLISDRRIQAKLRNRLKRLEYEPDIQGKRLGRNLAGYLSVRVVEKQYRIIYRVVDEQVLVIVVVIGRRKEGDRDDVYAVANKLAEQGLLG